MNAEILRRAAALMRERADKAAEGDHKWWCAAPLARVFNQQDAEHIASWHPDVALAVADWLDETAIEFEADPSDCCGDDTGSCGSWFCAQVAKALAVARAYLGETA